MFLDYFQSDTVDGMIGNISSTSSYRKGRVLKNFNRTRLLELSIMAERRIYFCRLSEKKTKTGGASGYGHLSECSGTPESGDIEASLFPLMLQRKIRDRVFSILTDREYDFVRRFWIPKNNTIRFLNLSSRLLPKYREKLGKPDASFPVWEDMPVCGRYVRCS